jgi:hypothetical protein
MKENRERWMKLCEQAANEQDPGKLMELVAEINRLLEEKEQRLKSNIAPKSDGETDQLRPQNGESVSSI